MDRRTKALAFAAIAALAVPAATAVADAGGDPAAQSAATRTIRLKDSYFSPSSLTRSGKATVRFVWAGRLGHNLVGRRIPASYESARIRHKALTRTYGRGTFRFTCTIHPGMTFRLRVR
jgi:plastocyanin